MPHDRGGELSAVAEVWPLVGRDDELARIADAAERGCCGVVISATAGAGKTRLGREALAAAEHDGAMSLWVQATMCARTIPLGAFAGLLPDGVRGENAPAAVKSDRLARARRRTLCTVLRHQRVIDRLRRAGEFAQGKGADRTTANDPPGPAHTAGVTSAYSEPAQAFEAGARLHAFAPCRDQQPWLPRPVAGGG